MFVSTQKKLINVSPPLASSCLYMMCENQVKDCCFELPPLVQASHYLDPLVES